MKAEESLETIKIKLYLQLHLFSAALAVCEVCKTRDRQKLWHLRNTFERSLLVFPSEFKERCLLWFDNAATEYMEQIKEISDGSRDVVRLWEDETTFCIVAVVKPADMTKTDMPTQTYVDLPKKFAKEIAETMLTSLKEVEGE